MIKFRQIINQKTYLIQINLKILKVKIFQKTKRFKKYNLLIHQNKINYKTLMTLI